MGGYTGRKIQHGNGPAVPYAGPTINISGLPLDLQYAVCRYAAAFTYGRDRVSGVFGGVVKTGKVESMDSVNRMTNLGGLTGAGVEEAAAFESEHPEWAAAIKAYVEAKRS